MQMLVDVRGKSCTQVAIFHGKYQPWQHHMSSRTAIYNNRLSLVMTHFLEYIWSNLMCDDDCEIVEINVVKCPQSTECPLIVL